MKFWVGMQYSCLAATVVFLLAEADAWSDLRVCPGETDLAVLVFVKQVHMNMTGSSSHYVCIQVCYSSVELW